MPLHPVLKRCRDTKREVGILELGEKLTAVLLRQASGFQGALLFFVA